jgi:AraC-like DNA-binding protein
MEEVQFLVEKDLEPFINCVMVGENKDLGAHTNIPLYADGYPGIMFQKSENGFYLLPKKKKLSEFFLYGQTLKPVSLDVKGPYKFVVFQLYPFASKYLLGVDPKELNDECFDLYQLQHIDMKSYNNNLANCSSLEGQVKIISQLMRKLINWNLVSPNDKVQQAIDIILQHDGKITVRKILDQVHLTERTFERNFLSQVGLTPKQFAKIIQFQRSLRQLTKTNFDKLIDIGHDSGFSDQSHFIRTFKKYTGQTPSYYLAQ